MNNEILISEGMSIGLSLYSSGDCTDKIGDEIFFRHSALMPGQTHSLNVAVAKHESKRFPDTDAIVTFTKDLPVGVRTADCVPVLLYSPDAQGVAAVHAGWKGTLGGIVDRTLDVFEEHGADMAEMHVAFGPSISMENYEVDRELADRFVEAGFADCVFHPHGEDGKPHVDLQGVNLMRLLRRGVRRENIRLHEGCTYGSVDSDGTPLYQSYRRDGEAAGRMLTSIMLLAGDSYRRYDRLVFGDDK